MSKVTVQKLRRDPNAWFKEWEPDGAAYVPEWEDLVALERTVRNQAEALFQQLGETKAGRAEVEELGARLNSVSEAMKQLPAPGESSPAKLELPGELAAQLDPDGRLQQIFLRIFADHFQQLRKRAEEYQTRAENLISESERVMGATTKASQAAHARSENIARLHAEASQFRTEASEAAQQSAHSAELAKAAAAGTEELASQTADQASACARLRDETQALCQATESTIAEVRGQLALTAEHARQAGESAAVGRGAATAAQSTLEECRAFRSTAMEGVALIQKLTEDSSVLAQLISRGQEELRTVEASIGARATQIEQGIDEARLAQAGILETVATVRADASLARAQAEAAALASTEAASFARECAAGREELEAVIARVGASAEAARQAASSAEECWRNISRLDEALLEQTTNAAGFQEQSLELNRQTLELARSASEREAQAREHAMAAVQARESMEGDLARMREFIQKTSQELAALQSAQRALATAETTHFEETYRRFTGAGAAVRRLERHLTIALVTAGIVIACLAGWVAYASLSKPHAAAPAAPQNAAP